MKNLANLPIVSLMRETADRRNAGSLVNRKKDSDNESPMVFFHRDSLSQH